MNPETNIATNNYSRLQTSAFYILLATVILAPLAFWPSQYFALESVKTLVIGILTMATFIILAIIAAKERQIRLPPKSMISLGILISLSLIASAAASGHFAKSFFGQGFEIGAASFILTLMVAGLVSFSIVARSTDRVIIIYAGIVATFLILWIFQTLRLIIGPNFASLGILGTTTSTILGSWFSLGILAAVIDIICLLAITFLPLSRKMKIAYGILFGLGSATMIVVNSHLIWQASIVVFLGLTIYLSSQRVRPAGPVVISFVKRLAWFPLLAFLVSLLFAWNGYNFAGSIVNKLNTGYTEFSLPWRMTLDIAAGELKENPLLGSGPNRFAQAYLTYKPTIINTTDAWGVEFNTGFGLIPTFLVTQGFLGGLLWILFFVFFGILGVRSLRGLVNTPISIMEAERPYARFVVISSYAAAALVWLMTLIYVPTHAVLYLGFLMTGIWLGTAVAYGRLSSVDITGTLGMRSYKLLPILAWISAVVALVWGLSFVRNTAALAYFGKGVKALTAIGNPQLADRNFATAVKLNPLDIYWQGRAEAGIALTKQMISTITATSTASTSEAVAKSAATTVNQSLEYSNKAIAADTDNYNNYISQARVGEIATAMRIPQAYEVAVDAYTRAIQHNRLNPSLYLSLARLQAAANQIDAAIQTVGAALQVKNNYLDAVYLLSQLEAAKGNLNDAIIAAQFATELNPTNPLLFFQLGLLQYTNADYASALKSFLQATTLETNYANAQYFLGLSYARLGDTGKAITIFENLGASNPDNQDIMTILTTLRSGRSLFAAPVTAAAASAEKRSGPPLPEN